MVRIFEIENKAVKLTEHCYIISWLKAILEAYPEPEQHMPRFAYIFYMSCPSQENPYYNVKSTIREDTIRNDITIDFDTEDDLILTAVERLTSLYETPTVRAYVAVTIMLDNITDYMQTATVTAGRDGNLPALIKLAKEFDEIRQSYKGVAKDLEAEQATIARGGQNMAYDQL